MLLVTILTLGTGLQYIIENFKMIHSSFRRWVEEHNLSKVSRRPSGREATFLDKLLQPD